MLTSALLLTLQFALPPQAFRRTEPTPPRLDLLEAYLRATPSPPAPPDPTNAWADDERAAAFGQFLFFDRRFSGYRISCASCHPAGRDFTDNTMTFRGPEAVRRRTLTVLDAARHEWFGWDGRDDTLWGQALRPFEDITEHDGSRAQFAHLVAEDPELRAVYEGIFGELPDLTGVPREAKPAPYHPEHRHHVAWLGMSAAQREAVTGVFVNLGKAVAAYERRLLTGDSAFDRYVALLAKGDPAADEAISPEAQRGAELFFGEADCVRCHSGPNFADGKFHDTRLPAINSIGEDPGRALGVDKLNSGEFGKTSRWSDDPNKANVERAPLPARDAVFGQFRTASLRSLGRNREFMHQAQFESLEEVVRYYSTLEGARPLAEGEVSVVEPLGLSEQEIDDLVAFLKSLEGDPPPAEWTERPRSLDGVLER
jgi:cytochrome c peroxidase